MIFAIALLAEQFEIEFVKVGKVERVAIFEESDVIVPPKNLPCKAVSDRTINILVVPSKGCRTVVNFSLAVEYPALDFVQFSSRTFLRVCNRVLAVFLASQFAA